MNVINITLRIITSVSTSCCLAKPNPLFPLAPKSPSVIFPPQCKKKITNSSNSNPNPIIIKPKKKKK